MPLLASNAAYVHAVHNISHAAPGCGLADEWLDVCSFRLLQQDIHVSRLDRPIEGGQLNPPDTSNSMTSAPPNLTTTAENEKA